MAMAQHPEEKLTRGTVRTEYVPDCEPLRERAEAAEAKIEELKLENANLRDRIDDAHDYLDFLGVVREVRPGWKVSLRSRIEAYSGDST